MQLKRSSRAGWEYFVLVCVVGCSMLLAVSIYAKRDQVAKERLMILELQRLRNEVMATMLEHRTRPTEFANIPLDPFGNPYHYNPKTGSVSSATPKYKGW